ncbi:MAG: hypothetical protein ABJA93_02225 [Sporichthyaceae bacterium]
MKPHLTTTVTAGLAAAIVLSACSGSSSNGTAASSSVTSPRASTPTHSTPSYHPTISPADFSPTITNPYFPLKPGTTKIYEGVRDGKPTHSELVTTTQTRMVMGVTCVVVHDTVTSGGALVEKTDDWYAQHKDGTVWYFGENTAEYVNGVVSSTHGTWEAGVDGAVPGVIMYAKPTVGTAYYQEFRPGEAEDRAKILTLDTTIAVPAGTFHNVITTEDSDPLNPDKTDKKWFAPGVGVVHSTRIRSGHHEESSLVKVTTS